MNLLFKTKLFFLSFLSLSLFTSNTLQGNASNYVQKQTALNTLTSERTSTKQTPVSVDSYGAVGDGIHDDSTAIQEAFDNNNYVCFTAGKTYKLITNGLYIREDLVIQGNDATILIDDSYNPINSDFSKHVIRHAYNSQSEYLEINDLNICVQITHNNFSGNNGKNYLCILQPTYIDNVVLQNVNITVSPSKNKIINLWLDHGCTSFKMDNCALKNYTTYTEGGVLWFMSSVDKLFNKFTNFQNIEISNCLLQGTCGDEILSLYGSYSVDATIENCTIIGNNQSPNTTRPITIYATDKNSEYNVTFRDCTMACMYNTSLDNCSYDSFLGIGSNNPNNNFNILFVNCYIYADVQNCLLYPSLLQKNINIINSYDLANSNFKLDFSYCNIVCNNPIAGSSSTLSQNHRDIIALDFNMNNCSIICNNSLAVLTPIWQNNTFYYYTPTIKLLNNSILIKNCNSLLIHKYANLEVFFTNKNNTLFNDSVLTSSYINQNSISYITQS